MRGFVCDVNTNCFEMIDTFYMHFSLKHKQTNGRMNEDNEQVLSKNKWRVTQWDY